MSNSNKQVQVKLVKSVSGRLASHKACVTGLGLKKMNQVRVLNDSKEVRGMINKVSYMLEVTEI